MVLKIIVVPLKNQNIFIDFIKVKMTKLPMVGNIKNAVWIDIPQVKYKIKNNKKIGQDKHT